MTSSFGDYMREQSSLSGEGNIKWTHKNAAQVKTKKKKERKTSPTNIIYRDDKVKPHVEKIFKIEDSANKSKKKNGGKKFQTSSASNFKIVPGFSRKGR